MNNNTELSTVKNDILRLVYLKNNGENVLRPFSRDIFLVNTVINGSMYVEGIHELAAKLHMKDRVQLILEPENKYDSKAILVKNEKGQKLGYIPRRINQIPFHLMEAGKLLYGVVKGGDIGASLNPEDNWVEIYIDVYMVD